MTVVDIMNAPWDAPAADDSTTHMETNVPVEAIALAPPRKDFAACWAHVRARLPDVLRDEDEAALVHDALQPAFGELTSIFLHYARATAAGSETVAAATCLGLQEALALAADTHLCTRAFPAAACSRYCRRIIFARLAPRAYRSG